MCQEAFERLKRAITEEPVPALHDYTKPYEVQTDASNFAIEGVLMQDGHPIAFENRKLNEIERRYTVQEKEMTAVVHCLRTCHTPNPGCDRPEANIHLCLRSLDLLVTY